MRKGSLSPTRQAAVQRAEQAGALIRPSLVGLSLFVHLGRFQLDLSSAVPAALLLLHFPHAPAVVFKGEDTSQNSGDDNY